MTRLFLIGLLAGCSVQKEVAVSFGSEGEGLDGFMCKDSTGKYLLDRAQNDGGIAPASLVVDFVRLGGVPGCRTGQLIKWCATHECRPLSSSRACVPTTVPAITTGMMREELRAALLSAFRLTGENGVIGDAPDEFVIVRVVGSLESCSQLMPPMGTELPAFDKTKLLGCAYSCPVLLDRVQQGQDVYLGFETLTAQCEQGVRSCSDGELHWQP